jgi:hypothetical protein
MDNALDLQVLSTFDARRIEAPLRQALADSGITANIGLTQSQGMREYMLSPSPETEHIAGTIVLLRVEDWLREHYSSEGHPGETWAREELKNRVREFANEISVLAYRGKPVWFVVCPAGGWIAQQHKLTSLCRTYTNLLVARVGALAQITSLSWPAGLLGMNIVTDQTDSVPFTQETFARIAEVVATSVARVLASKSGATEATVSKSAELAAYLSGLQVRIDLAPADPSARAYVDKIIRTAASFSLTGEQPRIPEHQVDAAIASGNCILVSVADRLADHGPSGIIQYHWAEDSLVIDWWSLSCTVLGKQVEYALICSLAQIAQEGGCSQVVFEFQPSARNQPTQTFLASIADQQPETRFLISVAEATERINRKAVNPGAWILSMRGMENTANMGR